jgi:hypothetical protein
MVETFSFLKEMLPKIGVLECSRVLKRSRSSVTSQATRYGLYDSSDRIQNHKFESNVDATFFDMWNEFSSYVYGFFVTDGCISQNRRVNYFKKEYVRNILEFTQKDRDVLDQIRKVMRIKSEVKSDGRGCFRLRVGNEYLINKMMLHGATPRKSYQKIILPKVGKENDRHLLRGLIDGDGYIQVTDTKCYVWLYGSEVSDIYTEVKRICEGQDLPIPKVSVYKRSCNMQYIFWQGTRNVLMVLDFMYKDSLISLLRKKKLADFFLDGSLRKER